MHEQKTSKHLDITNCCHGDGLRLSQARSRQFIRVRALILCMHAVFVHMYVCVCVCCKQEKIKNPSQGQSDLQGGQRLRFGWCGVILKGRMKGPLVYMIFNLHKRRLHHCFYCVPQKSELPSVRDGKKNETGRRVGPHQANESTTLLRNFVCDIKTSIGSGN